MIQGDQDALGHPKRPHQGQPQGVHQKNGTWLYTIFLR